MHDLQDKLVTILGGSGFLGRYVAEALLARGARLRVTGRTAMSGMHIKPLGNLGQVQLMAADVRKVASISRAVSGADAVVNLIGSFDNMDAIQHIGAATIAKAAAQSGCAALVHISAIGADPHSKAEYGRSKAAGEAAVSKAFPNATILRPSIVFGREDQFINRFAGLIQMMPLVPVIGSATQFQPVYVGDVAQAVVAALTNDSHAGVTLELGGPEIYTMRALNQWIASAIGVRRAFVDVPGFAAQAMATLTGWLPGAPITLDQYRMLGSDNVVDSAKDGMKALNITPTPLDSVAPGWLDIYRKHGRFGQNTKAQIAR